MLRINQKKWFFQLGQNFGSSKFSAGSAAIAGSSKIAKVGSRGAVVSAGLSERKVAGSIPTIGDFHTVGPCKKAVFACLATGVK